MSETVLVIQTCHLSQFIFAAHSLRQKHPDWRIDAVVLDHPTTRALLNKESLFGSILFSNFKSDPFHSDPGQLDHYDRILFPLLNRGYIRPKLKLWKMACGRAYTLNYEGEMQPLSNRDRLRSVLTPLAIPPPEFVSFRQETKLTPLSGDVLLLESDTPARVEPALEKLPIERPATRLVRLQNIDAGEIWKVLRGHHFETVIVFLNQRPEYLLLQLFPLLLRISRVIVSESPGHFIEMTSSGYRRLVLRRLLLGGDAREECQRIVLLQTEVVEVMLKTLERIDQQPLLVDSKVTVVCRSEDEMFFRSHARVDEVLSFERGIPWIEQIRLWRKICSRNADAIAAVFSGRAIFRKQKLYFLLSTIRRHLVFNGALDCYWLAPHQLPRLLRTEASLSTIGVKHDVLLIQTETAELCRKAISRLASDSRIVPNARITVLCRQDKLPQFMEFPGVNRVLTYPMSGRITLEWLRSLLSERPDVVTAIFSGRPIFRKQKLLFFLIRAGSRLVFNEGLDCYYLDRKTIQHLLFPRPGSRSDATLWPSRWLRLLLKFFLFLPRFLFLVIWITLSRSDNWYTARRRGVDFP